MKLNKTFGRVATTLVAAAMLASLAAPVYAASVTQSDTSAEKTGMTTVSIDKQLVMPKDTSTPTMTFDFAITNGTVGNNDTVSLPVVGGEGKTTVLEVYNGEGANNTTVGSVQIDNTLQRKNWNNSDDIVYVEKELTLTLPAATSFSKAGVYKYDIKETTDFANTDYIDAMVDTETDKDGLDLYLIVERTNPSDPVSASDKYKITGAFVYPDGASSNPDGKTADYVNYYKLDSGGHKTVNSLTFTKKITGAMGDMADTFTFEVALPDDVASGTVFKYDRSGNQEKAKTDEDITVTNGKLTFNDVGHNETITVKGLDIGTEYTITETDADTYTVSTDGDDTDTNKDDHIAKLTITKNKVVSTTFTNTRIAVSPTGLAMDIAPYALLVVVAAAGCFVFLRKRSED